METGPGARPSARSPGERPTWVRYRVMGFLCVLSFLSYFDRVCIMRAQEDIRSDLGLTSGQMSMILSAFWFTYALLEIPAGWLGDRYGPRRTLARIVLSWSLFTALSGCASGFVSLLACRLLFGAGEAGAFPNMARVQASWLPAAAHARAGGLLWLLARWGGAFSPVLFGLLLRELGSWRYAFFAAGLMGLVWTACFYPWFRDRPEDKRSVNAAELRLIAAGRRAGEGGEQHRLDGRAWAALFTSPSLWAMALVYVASSFAWSFYVSWMPLYLKDVHKVDFAKSEWATAGPLFVGGISCLAGGWLSDRLVAWTGRKWLGRALLPILGYLTAAAAMFGVRFASTPGQAMGLLTLAAAAQDLGQGANWATFVDIGGLYAGTATGFINMVGNSGHWLQPPVGAWMFDHHGWTALFALYAAMYVVAASMWLFIDPHRRFYDPRPGPRRPLREDAELLRR